MNWRVESAKDMVVETGHASVAGQSKHALATNYGSDLIGICTCCYLSLRRLFLGVVPDSPNVLSGLRLSPDGDPLTMLACMDE